MPRSTCNLTCLFETGQFQMPRFPFAWFKIVLFRKRRLGCRYLWDNRVYVFVLRAVSIRSLKLLFLPLKYFDISLISVSHFDESLKFDSYFVRNFSSKYMNPGVLSLKISLRFFYKFYSCDTKKWNFSITVSAPIQATDTVQKNVFCL